MLKLLVTHTFKEQDTNRIKQLVPYYNIIFAQNEEEIQKNSDADVILAYRISEDLLNMTNNLKLIQIPGAGVNTLPLAAIKNKGILLCNSHSNAHVVAEHTVALLLASAKKIPYHDRVRRTGAAPSLPSTLLFEKKVGIIGFGSIDQKVAAFLQGFNCTIRTKENDTPLSDVIRADYLILTVPLTEETRNMITMTELKQMKPNASIINVSRAEVINKDDLFTALKNNIIASAAIDVWYDDYTKEQISTLPFNKLDNIIISPYRAAHVDGALHLNDVIENLKRFATGQELINVVNLNEGF
jgi:phosphoglycerate dehydrogenase-like enzyme